MTFWVWKLDYIKKHPVQQVKMWYRFSCRYNLVNRVMDFQIWFAYKTCTNNYLLSEKLIFANIIEPSRSLSLSLYMADLNHLQPHINEFFVDSKGTNNIASVRVRGSVPRSWPSKCDVSTSQSAGLIGYQCYQPPAVWC